MLKFYLTQTEVKTLKKIPALLAILSLTICMFGCKDKYCAVPDCPAESSRFSDYCFEHKCINSSCNNKGVDSYYYCSKCLNKA